MNLYTRLVEAETPLKVEEIAEGVGGDVKLLGMDDFTEV